MAEANKIPLTYLSTIGPEERRKLPEYSYHRARLRKLMEVVAEISALFDRRGVDYITFKTLRPYPEDVADIDMLNMGSRNDYKKIMKILEEDGYLLIGRGAYCTAFQEHKILFKAELMIDVYDEISASRIVYLDKRRLRNHVTRRSCPMDR